MQNRSCFQKNVFHIIQKMCSIFPYDLWSLWHARLGVARFIPRVPAIPKESSLLQYVSTDSGLPSPQPPIQWLPGFFPRSKWPERKACRPPPSCTQVECSRTSSSLIRLHGVGTDHFTFTFTFYIFKELRSKYEQRRMSLLTHCGRVTQICVFNTVKLGTSASSP